MRDYSEPNLLGEMPVDVWTLEVPLACMKPMPVHVGRDLRSDYVYITAAEDDGPLCISINVPVERLRALVDELTGILEGETMEAMS